MEKQRAILEPGETVHIMARRLREDDARRHFIGRTVAVEHGVARVEGWTFVLDKTVNEYVKRPGKRVRLFGLGDAANIVNVLPREVNIEDLHYALSADKRLTVTDGKSYHLDVNEFGPTR